MGAVYPTRGVQKGEVDDIFTKETKYLEGTDRLRIVNNLIGKCKKAGYFAKVVAFWVCPKRGGTSRENIK
jgi:hypothetical protein